METLSPVNAIVLVSGDYLSRLVKLMSNVNTVSAGPGRRRWLVLAVIGLAQLMVVLDATVMNIALPSAQHALHFSTVDRQWVVTAYTLAFGSLLLFGGRLADLLGRKVTFLIGLVGFAGVSAVGGASVGFAMLATARACQGAFAAILVPSALSLLTTTFTEPRERGRAFGVYGAIAAAGGAVGLLLGGALTEYLSWRWTLYINLCFAGVAFVGGAVLLDRGSARVKPQLDIPGLVLVSGGLFCLVYGFSNAATHSWHATSTYGFLVAGAVLLAAFGFWLTRAAHPLLPLRVVLDRNRGAAYLSMLFGSAAMFGTFLFLTYYLQQTLGYTPIVTGFAVLPIVAGIAVSANVSNIVLMPRLGPKPLVAAGMLIAAGAATWFAQLGPHTSYAGGVVGPLILTGVGLGMVIAPSINAGTFAVAPQDAGVASATVTVGQQLGASIGTSLLNTVFASAVTAYITAHAASARVIGLPALTSQALAHGYDRGFWWTAGILACGSIVAGILFRRGPLSSPGAQASQPGGPVQTEIAAGGPAIPA
jgi:EmrB/QacA subfamily drug resistance transporter